MANMVSIIIINYNTFQLTCDCIESVYRFTKNIAFEIVLVDNASPTDNPDDFLLKFPNILLIKSPDNGGFAKGNNLGIKHASGNILLLLNSDTILTEDSISIAADTLLKDKQIGAVGVKLIYPDGKLQPSARRFRSIKNEILDLLRPFLMLIPYRKRARMMLNQYFKGDFNTYCDWVSGAFIMFQASIMNELPEKKLDERFFMYGEDELWCYQFMELGYKNYYIADAAVIHLLNASVEPAKQLRLLKTYIDHEMIIMDYVHGKSWYYYCFRVLFVAKEMFRYYVKLLLAKLFNYQLR
jgi:GT2 family glycosyltransferase